MAEKLFYTVKELAKRWGVSEKRIYQLKDAPDDPIPYHKLGGIKFHINDILGYERTHRFPEEEKEEITA